MCQTLIYREKLNAAGDDPVSFYIGRQRCFSEKRLNPHLGESSVVVFLPYLEVLSEYFCPYHLRNPFKLVHVNKRLGRSANPAHFPPVLEK